MIALTALSIALLLWTAIYCVRKAISDFRGTTPASGIPGVIAVLGALIPAGLLSFALLMAYSGV
jgi:TRAP-type C4-dicarboxylate transport system permease small subunit